MMMAVALIVFVLTLFFTKCAIVFFPRFGLVDHPERYGLKRAPIPYYGGLVLYVVFVSSSLVMFPFDFRVLGVLLAATIIVSVSFLDDLFGIHPYVRLFVQVVAALLLPVFGVGISEIRNPFGGFLSLERFVIDFSFGEFALLGVFFTVIWVVLIMNTVNFLDGLNGLGSGVSAIGFFVLFILSLQSYHVIDQSQFSLLSLVLFVSVATFACFEFAPAKILMGDTGSMFLGFMLAVFGIFSGGKVATAFLVLGFPILDAFWVILRRLYFRKSPFKGDLKHLHHRFLASGLSERHALFVIYLICTAFGVSALLLEPYGKIVAFFLLFFVMGLAGVLVMIRQKKT